MKKLLAFLLSISFLFTACAVQENQEQKFDLNKHINSMSKEEIQIKYLYPIWFAAGYDWDKDNGGLLDIKLAFFKADLEALSDPAIKNINDQGYAKVDDYMEVYNKCFGFEQEKMAKKFRNNDRYDRKTDSIFMSDGLGSAMGRKVCDVTIDNDKLILQHIEYFAEESPEDIKAKPHNILTIQFDDKGNYQYVSNHLPQNSDDVVDVNA